MKFTKEEISSFHKLADSINDRFNPYKEAVDKYGDKVRNALKGKVISKRKDESKKPYGLEYEAKKLGMSLWDLLDVLEGLCREGHCQEIDDSHYKVIDSKTKA